MVGCVSARGRLFQVSGGARLGEAEGRALAMKGVGTHALRPWALRWRCSEYKKTRACLKSSARAARIRAPATSS